jgi:hypothetical protein
VNDLDELARLWSEILYLSEIGVLSIAQIPLEFKNGEG